MNRCKWKVLFLGACVLAACSKKTETSPEVGKQFKEGQLIVKTDNLQKLLSANKGLTSVDLYPEANIYMVKGESLNGKEAEFAQAWKDQQLVKYADPNYIRSIGRTTDPLWSDLWGLENKGQDAPNGTEGKEGADIHLMEAWKTSTGSKDIIVAVMDTGIDYKHDDLRDNIYINQKEFKGEIGKDNDGNGYANDVYGWNFTSVYNSKLYHGQLGSPDPMDGHGHGTHVSGTIGAVANNGIGVAGINQHVSLMALKVLSDEGSGEDGDIIRAIRYAAMVPVDVVNASFGGGGKSENFLDALKQAGKAGVLFVAAAGNEASDNDTVDAFPANYELDSLISVAATDNRDQLAEFSNYGYQKVDIAAPGVNIVSTYPTAIAEREGTPNSPYRVFSGTSMATPHVTGAAALVLSAVPELRHHPDLLKKRLMETVDWLPQLAGRVRSGGRLNVARAISGEIINPLDDKNWIEEPRTLASANKPDEHIDQLLPITVDGAKAISVHIKNVLMDSIDLAALYDSTFRLISFIPGDKVDYWTPVVFGDTVVLRFANALVSIQKVKEKVIVDDPSTLTGQVMCFPARVEGKFQCTVWDEPEPPVGNDRSEGFVVDKVRYLKL